MKSNIKDLDLEAIGQKMVDFFSNGVEKAARASKFVRRKSPISGQVFLKALVLGYLEKPKASLNEIAQTCLDLGVAITPQAINERINAFSVAFVQSMFYQAMMVFKSHQPLKLAILQQFTAINLVDSTTKTLPDSMAAEYPGSGGKAALSSLKIQLVFDFLSGNMKQLEIQAGNDPDQAYRGYLQMVQEGSLTIADLGYFCLDAFAAIAKKMAYFLSRYSYPTTLFSVLGQRIDLVKFLQAQTEDAQELSVFLGSRLEHKLACRLILLRTPEKVAEERRRKAKEHAKKRGRTLGATYLFLLGWTLFVTNAPASMISTSQVHDFYRIRWQIELIFKLWKSYSGLNHLCAWRKERVLTELYAKLIGLVIVHFLLAPLRNLDETWQGREISTVKFKKLLERFSQRLKQQISHISLLIKTLDDFMAHALRFALKEKRRKQPSTCSRLATFSIPGLA
jgi:hypothetical protein